MAKRIIKPDSGNTLVLQEDNGSIDALTVETNGDVTLAGNFTSNGHVRANTFKNLAGTGAPDFPNGLTLASNATGGNVTGVTLDDYEEGTFDVTFTASSSVTYSCHYVKIGNAVFFANHTVGGVVGGGTSLTFSGTLPFTPNSAGTARFGLLRTVTSTPISDIMLAWNKDSATLYLYKMNTDDSTISSDTITKDSRTVIYVTFNGFFITD